MAAIDRLTAEHRVIEQMVALLERLAGRLGRDGDLPAQLLAELVDLVAQYSDKLHHAKEEQRLFQIVIERGVEAEGGAVSTLLRHHETGRSYLQDLRGELHRLRQGDRNAVAGCALVAGQYATLMRNHIRLEDEQVFPLVARAMSEEEDRALVAYYAEFDASHHAADLRARFARLLDRSAELEAPRAPGSA